jgi:hypothetical protein
MGHGSDLTTELAGDHRLLELLLSRLEADKDADAPDRTARIDQLAAALTRHAAITERYLYPALCIWILDGTTLAERGRQSQAVAALTMRDIAARDLLGQDLGPPIARLRDQLARHVRDEEERLIPTLSAAVTWHVLEDLGDRVRTSRLAAADPAPGWSTRRPRRAGHAQRPGRG